MKKALAIFAAAALCSVALADNPATNSYTLDAASTWLYVDQYGKWTTSSTSVNVGNVGESWNLNINNVKGSNNYPNATIAVTLDLSKLVTPNAATSLLNLWVNGGSTAIGMGLTTDRMVAPQWGSTIPWSDYTVGNSALGSEGLVTLIFSTSGSGSSYSIEGQRFSDTYNGWSWSGLRGSSTADINVLTISGALSSALVSLAVWDYQDYQNLGYEEVYATMSSLSQAYSPSPAVPEPATATLSLLALAGMAARRRRK